jgi:hypothetical protein
MKSRLTLLKENQNLRKLIRETAVALHMTRRAWHTAQMQICTPDELLILATCETEDRGLDALDKTARFTRSAFRSPA